MNINKIINDLPNMSIKDLKAWQSRARAVPKHLASYPDAKRLLSAVEDQLAQPRKSNLTKVGLLWWEPHDPYVSEFHGYANPDAQSPVATIFKANTHTATRKAVYSVRIGDDTLDGQFAEVATARRVGSEAWEERQKQV